MWALSFAARSTPSESSFRVVKVAAKAAYDWLPCEATLSKKSW